MKRRALTLALILGVASLLLYGESVIRVVIDGTPGFLPWIDRLLAPVLLFGIPWLCRGVVRWLLVGLASVGTMLILLGDRASLEYSGDPLNIHQTSASGQLWEIRSSILALLGTEGVSMFLGALLLPLAGWWWERRARRIEDAPPRSRTRLILLLVLIVAAGIRLVCLWSLTPAQNEPLAVMRNHGALVHHLIEFRDRHQGRGAPKTLDPGQRRALEATLAHKALLNRTESPFFGLAKGRNVLVVQLEAFEHFLLDLQVPAGVVTPHINRLAEGGLSWHGMLNLALRGRSSDSEFSAMTSLFSHPTKIVSLEFGDRDWTGLPELLRAANYQTYSFHPFRAEFWNRIQMHPGYGIDHPHFADKFRPGRMLGWGLSDVDFMVQAAEIVTGGPAPFFALHTTLTSHHPFSALPEELLGWDVGPVESGQLANYLRITHYTDSAIGSWVEALRQGGQFENSLIVLYGDHNAGFTRRGRAALATLAGGDHDGHETDRVMLVVAVPGKEDFIRAHRAEFDRVLGGSVDLAPTILHLLGMPIPVGMCGTHLFVQPEQRDPRMLMTGRHFVYRGEVHELPAPEVPLAPAERSALRSQSEFARLMIEQDGQALFRRLGEADTATLQGLAAGDRGLTEPPPKTDGSREPDAVQSFPLVEFPPGEMVQTIRHADAIGGFPPQLVADGGGAFRGLRSSNSLEALDTSARLGYRMIQVDLTFTRDDHLVLLRDWQETWKRLYQGPPGPLTLAEFRAATPIHGTTPLTLPDLIAWLDRHPDIAVLTAIPEQAIRALTGIRDRFPDHRDRILPMVATAEEFDAARSLGFVRVLLIPDRNRTGAEIQAMVGSRNVYAVVLPADRPDLAAIAKGLGDRKVSTYARVVNQRFPWAIARSKGLDGVFTDDLGLGHTEGEAPPVLPVWTIETSRPRLLGSRLLPMLPPPRFRWESGPDLELRNPTRAPVQVTLRATTLAGDPLADRILELDPGDATRVWLRQFFLAEAGRISIHGDGATAAAFWGMEDGSRARIAIATAAHGHFAMRGSTAGVHGYSVAIVNPSATPAKVILKVERQPPTSQEDIVIPAGGTVVRSYFVRPGETEAQVEIDGDPVVVQGLHWDPELRSTRER